MIELLREGMRGGKRAHVGLAGCLVAAALLAVPGCEWIALGPLGFSIFRELEILIWLLIYLCVPTAALSAFALLVPKVRSNSGGIVITFILMTLAGLLSLQMVGYISRYEYGQVAIRGKRIVDAIRRYEAVNAKPPPDLNALVPGFIDAVPGTGMPSYPTFEYAVGRPEQYDGNPWALYVNCFDIGGWDIFLYLPRQNYPKYGYGGGLERMGDWAYVHE